MKDTLKLSAVALAFVSILLAGSPAEAHTASAGAAKGQRTAYDAQFLDTMAEHHREGIAMFQLAADKAQNKEIRDMAGRMIRDQEREIPELESMHEAVAPNTVRAVNHKLPGMKPMYMRSLESASGRPFDDRFLAMTVEHHKGALAMSRDALKRARSDAVRRKAQEIIDKQTAEIAELERMRASL